MRSLDLAAPTEEIFKFWYNGLRCIMKHLEDIEKNVDVDRRFLKSKWDKADPKKTGTISRKDVLKLISSMHMNLPTAAISKAFKEVDRDKSNTLDFEEFCNFMNILRRRYRIIFLIKI